MVDIHEHVAAICEAVGVDSNYAFRLEVVPGEVVVHCFAGRDGFCKGAKYTFDEGKQATNELRPERRIACEAPRRYEVRA